MDYKKKFLEFTNREKNLRILKKENINKREKYIEGIFDIIYSKVFLKYFPLLHPNITIKRRNFKYHYHINSSPNPFFSIEFISKGEVNNIKELKREISINFSNISGKLENNYLKIQTAGEISNILYKNKKEILKTLNHIVYVKTKDINELYLPGELKYKKFKNTFIEEFFDTYTNYFKDYFAKHKTLHFGPVNNKDINCNTCSSKDVEDLPYFTRYENEFKGIKGSVKIELIKNGPKYVECIIYDIWGVKWPYKEEITLYDFIKKNIFNISNYVKDITPYWEGIKIQGL
jgi:hypothetical protein